MSEPWGGALRLRCVEIDVRHVSGSKSTVNSRRKALRAVPCLDHGNLALGNLMMTRFRTTEWNVVAAANSGQPSSALALEALCCAYRAPVFAYVRALARPDEDAEEMTQAFFLQFLQHHYYEQADRERGRFRQFVKASVRNFIYNWRDQAEAAKRGSAATTRLDQTHEIPGAPRDTPDQVFDRAWALAVLEQALVSMRSEAMRAGKSGVFDRLVDFIVEQPDAADYDRAASDLGMSRGTVGVTVHRLRERLRNHVRVQLARTLTHECDLDIELELLQRALRS